VGVSKAGPIGPGLLASGSLGVIVRQLQAAIDDLESFRPSK